MMYFMFTFTLAQLIRVAVDDEDPSLSFYYTHYTSYNHTNLIALPINSRFSTTITESSWSQTTPIIELVIVFLIIIYLYIIGEERLSL